MSGDYPPGEGGDPFEGLPFFGDFLSQLAGSSGGVSWDTAKQLATALATGGESEPNVDPTRRIALEQLARVAELHVREATGLSVERPLSIRAVTRSQWAIDSIDAFRHVFEALAATLASTAGGPADEQDPLMDPLMKALTPMLLSFTAGGLVGHLARRSLGTYDLPLPRRDLDDILVVVSNIDEFRDDWSLPADELELWVCLHDVSHHHVLSIRHVADRIDELLVHYANSFETDPRALEDKLPGFAPGNEGAADLESLQELMGDPELLLGAVESPAQRTIAADLAAVTAAIVGYVDHVMDEIGARLIPSYGQLTEALRRRRVEADGSDRFVERLLGLELTQEQYDRGRAFVDGVVERAGASGLARLWSDVGHLPTPNEIDAPGLWLARIDLPDEES